MKVPAIMRLKIRPSVRAKLEELGVDVVRTKLIPILGVSKFEEQDKTEELGDGLSATRREIQEWLKEKAASDRRWMKAAAIAAAMAAIISFLFSLGFFHVRPARIRVAAISQ